MKGKNGGGGGQKGRWDPTDNGSEAKAVDGIADKGDPNYDSEADEHDNNYVLVRGDFCGFPPYTPWRAWRFGFWQIRKKRTERNVLP